jgi:hypothetical protein
MRLPKFLVPFVVIFAILLHPAAVESKGFVRSCTYPNIRPLWVDLLPLGSKIHLELHAACYDMGGRETFPVLDLSKCLTNNNGRLEVCCPSFTKLKVSNNSRLD